MGAVSWAELIITAVEHLDTGASDRKSLAGVLGIGLSQAGKAASALISMKIASEYAKRDGSPGRRSGILTLREDPVFAVVHISAKEILTEVFGYSLKITGRGFHEIDDPLFLDDVFISYFRRLHKTYPKLLDICLVCSGIDSNGRILGSGIPGLDGLSIIQMSKEHLPDTDVHVANAAISSLTDSSGINAVISECGGSVRVSLIHDGILLSGSHGVAGITNRLRDRTGRSISTRIRHSRDHREYSSAMAELFSQVILLTDPHRIFFECGKYSSADEILREISEILIIDHGHSLRELPELITAGDKFDPSLTSLRKQIRNSRIIRCLTDI